MLLNILSFKNLCKSLLIEGLSIAAAFLTNYLIKDDNTPTPAQQNIRFSLALRIYYLNKNFLYVLDTLFITKENNLRHLYSGCYNFGVACSIYPAKYLLPDFATRTTNIIGAQSIIYATGITLRLLIEKNIANQTIKQHIAHNQGKLLGGFAGVFLSAIPSSAIDSPALYWSGEISDIFKIRTQGESLLSVLLSTRSTVPVQAFFSQITKMSFKLANIPITIPEFVIDGITGSSYSIMISALGNAIAKTKEPNANNPNPRNSRTLELEQISSTPPTSNHREVNISLPPI